MPLRVERPRLPEPCCVTTRTYRRARLKWTSVGVVGALDTELLSDPRPAPGTQPLADISLGIFYWSLKCLPTPASRLSTFPMLVFGTFSSNGPIASLRTIKVWQYLTSIRYLSAVLELAV